MTRKNGFLAVSPVLVLALLMLGLGVMWGDFYKVSLPVVFAVVLVYGVCVVTLRGALTVDADAKGLKGRLAAAIDALCRGAGRQSMLLMLWIFLLAGAFAATARSMGAIDATVQLTLALTPTAMLLPGLFLAACFVSLSVGTSVGTIVALVPIASALSAPTGLPQALLVASVVGGAFFGDNLSFISDTTIVATRSQGVELADKFKTNVWIAVPAAVITLCVLFIVGVWDGAGAPLAGVAGLPSVSLADVDFLKVLPYVVVLVAAVMGANVLAVLVLGNVLAALVGMVGGDLSLEGWMAASAGGMAGMSDTILVAFMASGLMELIRCNGGIGYLISILTRRVNGRIGAEFSIAALVGLTNCCTANNTVAILSVGKISADIADRFGVDRRKSASLLDTFSCVVQGLLPYGAQLLIAADLAGITPMEIIPHLYYNAILALVAIVSIIFGFPRKVRLSANAIAQV